MCKTLYISDMDGTLLGAGAVLSECTRAALNLLAENGMHFTVATARTAASTGRIMAGAVLSAPAVLMNGVLIYDFAQKRYEKLEALGEDSVRGMMGALRRFGASALMYALDGGEQTVYYETLEPPALRQMYDERVRIRGSAAGFRHVEDFAMVTQGSIIYFTLRGAYEELMPVYKGVEELDGIGCVLYSDTYDSSYWYLECYNARASKGSGVEYLRERYGYERVVGFGDNLNDLPLFEACDEAYATENAMNEVKAAATGVIAANTADGVAEYLLSLIG